MPAKNVRTQRVQFWVQDVKLQTAMGIVVPYMAPMADLLQAMLSVSTLWLHNQKNGQRGATIHHTACSS
jgi:hypothetical protein